MPERTLADILDEITAFEIKDGHDSPKVKKLREEVYNHPDAFAGRDLPPVVGILGV